MYQQFPLIRLLMLCLVAANAATGRRSRVAAEEELAATGTMLVKANERNVVSGGAWSAPSRKDTSHAFTGPRLTIDVGQWTWAED